MRGSMLCSISVRRDLLLITALLPSLLSLLLLSLLLSLLPVSISHIDSPSVVCSMCATSSAVRAGHAALEAACTSACA